MSVSIQCRTTREVSKKALPAGTLTFMSQILMPWRQNSRRAMSSFFNHSRTTMMVCGDLKSRTLTAICCSSGVLVHERRFKQMLKRATFAFLVMTAEDEHADDKKHARENVIHEIG